MKLIIPNFKRGHKSAEGRASARRKQYEMTARRRNVCNRAHIVALIVDTANGKPAKNEINNTKEIAIFKTGVTL